MHDLLQAWLVGGVAIASTTASIIFNALLAFHLRTNHRLQLGLRLLLFIAFGMSIIGMISLSYYSVVYPRHAINQKLELRASVWTIFGIGVITSFVSLAVPGVAVIWLLAQQKLLTTVIWNHRPTVWVTAWIGTWGASILTHAALFAILAWWTKQMLKSRSVGRLDLDFGIRLPPMDEIVANNSRVSLASRETTMASPPRTPSSTHVGSSPRYSTSSKAAAGTSRTKLLGRASARSSMDAPSLPMVEPQPAENAFDRWDTSSVHHEMRIAAGSPPIVGRTGLETIPGSRSESPANALDGPFMDSSPRVLTSETATAVDLGSSPPRQMVSSPASSPPNFSRPTSRNTNKPLGLAFEIAGQELIHPLFRTNSPHPPPIATVGTTITASPMANELVTPRTLTRLRSNSSNGLPRTTSAPTGAGHWRAMPSVDSTSQRPSTAGSMPGSVNLGSPGPSVADEEELPPILPGFVLSAGKRSSFVGYSARKSLRKGKT